MTMETKQTAATLAIDEVNYVSAADQAHRIIFLIQHGLNPMQIGSSMHGLVHRTLDRC